MLLVTLTYFLSLLVFRDRDSLAARWALETHLHPLLEADDMEAMVAWSHHVPGVKLVLLFWLISLALLCFIRITWAYRLLLLYCFLVYLS